MKKIKGKKEYEKFKAGKELTRKEAILAQCYFSNMHGEVCHLHQHQDKKT